MPGFLLGNVSRLSTLGVPIARPKNGRDVRRGIIRRGRGGVGQMESSVVPSHPSPRKRELGNASPVCSAASSQRCERPHFQSYCGSFTEHLCPKNPQLISPSHRDSACLFAVVSTKTVFFDRAEYLLLWAAFYRFFCTPRPVPPSFCRVYCNCGLLMLDLRRPQMRLYFYR